MLKIPIFLLSKASRTCRATVAIENRSTVETSPFGTSVVREGAPMPKKRLNIRVTSTVRDPIDPHQLAGILLDWYAEELKSGRMTPTCLQTHGLNSECICVRSGADEAAEGDIGNEGSRQLLGIMVRDSRSHEPRPTGSVCRHSRRLRAASSAAVVMTVPVVKV